MAKNVCMHACMYVGIYACMCVCDCVRMYVCMYTKYLNINEAENRCIYIERDVHVAMYLSICLYVFDA